MIRGARPRAHAALAFAPASAAALLLGLSCGPIESPPGSTTPVNSCLATACSTYSPAGAQAGSMATCQSGACVVTAPASVTDPLILVVAVAEDSWYAPGRTFAVKVADLFAGNSSLGCSAPSCCPPDCAILPAIGVISRSYVITPQVAMSITAPLGNSGTNTALPVQALYRPLWVRGATSGYATSFGLPLEPIQADVFYDAYSPDPGPNHGPSVVFETYLQVGLQYELAAQPDPPLSAVYPPEITPLSPGAGPPFFAASNPFDFTTGEPGLGPTIPQFDISRAAGLDGWTAYLRDATTGNIVSNVAPLSGTLASQVRLATNRFDGNSTDDALTNAELVVAPPAGAPIPAGIFAPVGVPPALELPPAETYPALPSTVTVTGTLTTPTGAPVLADLTFQAISIIAAGTENTQNFEFVGRAATSMDPRTGAATYTVVLPPGQYSEVVRPSDSSAAVTLGSVDVPAQAGPLSLPAMTLWPLQPVRGSARVADGRLLSGATVEVIPTQCATSPAATTLPAVASSSVFCLPRASQMTTGLDGSFLLSLDPGEYLLRVRPADGTRLPWISQPLSVGQAAVTVPTIWIPAPVSVGLRLVDPKGNPIVRSVVSVYSLPAQGAALELGTAVTDSNGHYDLYITPSP